MRGRILSICALVAIATTAAAEVVPVRGTAASSRSYDVTVTNLTYGQVMSPPILVVHDPAVRLWELGSAASPELAAVAEDADAAGLTAALDAMLGVEVDDWTMAGGVLPPGASVTLEVSTGGGCRALTLVSMLVTTNDAFAGIDATPLRGCGAATGGFFLNGWEVVAEAYDAGSEANTESCADIPGPPCGNGGVHPADGIGFVHVHRGVHGIADLVPDEHDWRNPVAVAAIRAVHP